MARSARSAAPARGTTTPAAARPAGAPSRFALPALFVISGAAALLFELVWTRWLVLALGASTRATTLVLAVFMGGLGLGAWLAGRLGDRHPARVLRLFAAAEAAIGAWGLLSIVLVGRGVPHVSAWLASALGADTLPVAARAALAAAVLLPPTVLMGATLPLCARWAVSAGFLPARGVGALYTLNTLGGMLGVFAGAFVLVEALGLTGAAILASCADLAVAGGVLALARMAPAAAPVSAPAPDGAAAPRTAAEGAAQAAGATGTDRFFAIALVAWFVSGFAGLAFEVVVARILAMLAGSSVYAFAIMLGSVLAGIAGGAALVAARADRVARPAVLLGVTLTALAAGIGFAQRLFAAGGYTAAGRAAASLPGLSGWSYGFELAGAFLLLLPASLALGAAMPLVARVAAAAPAHLAGRVGLAYFANTGGALCGAALAGLVLVPALGTARALTAITALAAIAGLAIVVAASDRAARTRALAPALVLGLGGLVLGAGADPVRAALDQQLRGATPRAFLEGPVQTIAVVDEDNDQQLAFQRIITNRTSLTGTHAYARRYMTLLSHLPALWGPEPKSALVICYGTGMTAGAAATYPSLARLDVAEISPEIISLAPLFDAASGRVLGDARTKLHVEDGRHVLLAARAPWDFVTLEPPPPRDAGVVSLYSTDFYALAKSRVTPGGIVAQWIPLHSQTIDEIRMLVRSFTEVFPHVLGFLPVERDLLLLGSERALTVDPARMARRMEAPAVRDSLHRSGFYEPADLLATALLDRDALRSFAGGAPLVSDDRPAVEYFARFGKKPGLPDVTSLAAQPLPLERLVDGTPDPALRARFETARAALSKLLRGAWSSEQGRGQEGDQARLEAVRLRPFDLYYQWAAGASDEHLARLSARAARGELGPKGWTQVARLQVQRQMFREGAGSLEKQLAATPGDPETQFLYGTLLVQYLKDPRGEEYLARVRAMRPPGAPGRPAGAAGP